jgi:hypothetical protein
MINSRSSISLKYRQVPSQLLLVIRAKFEEEEEVENQMAAEMAEVTVSINIHGNLSFKFCESAANFSIKSAFLMSKYFRILQQFTAFYTIANEV